MKQTALMIKQARKHKMQADYSNMACVWIQQYWVISEDGYTISRGTEVGGHSFISFSQKLRLESSHFCNSVRLAETAPDRKVRVLCTMRTNKGHSTWRRMWSQPLENKAVLEERWHNSTNGDGQKTCVTDEHNPWHNSSDHRKERQENRPGNTETLYCFQVP